MFTPIIVPAIEPTIRSLFIALIGAVLIATPVRADTILFVGNSFTFAANTPIHNFRHETVTDLNHEDVGGIPALFKAFTSEASINYAVSLETAGGMALDWHYENKASEIARPWDNVVLQSYSTLDESKPGDPTKLVQSVKDLSALLTGQNPKTRIYLMSTWTRADQTYLPTGHWYGKPIDAMEKDVRAGYDLAATSSPSITGIIPVGQAWNRAITTGFALANPYASTSDGKVDLWSYDHYHGSIYGYYIEALTVFGAVTGLDPRSLGPEENCASELGITPDQAAAMQRIAFDELTLDSHLKLKSFTSRQPIVH